MPVVRRILSRAAIPGVAALLLGVPAAAAHASAASAASGAVIEVALPGSAVGPPPPGVQQVGSVYAAQALAATLAKHENVTVELEGGTYRLSHPLTYTAADAGRNGYTITWEALPDAHPVLSGAQQIEGWQLYDAAKNIWVADVGKGTNTRQLYVNGKEAPNAAIQVPRSDITFTATGLTITNSSFGYLASLPDQNQIQLESLDSFTDRYAPVQSISGTTITMQQPAWANNNWGYDVLARPFAGGTMYLGNSLAFINQPGQWAVDSSAGKLYYQAPAGQTMQGTDVELPRLPSLLDISGSYSDPAQGLTFSGIQFSGTTWLGPSTSQGYADQQSGTFITGTWHSRPSGAASSAACSSRRPGSTGIRCPPRCRSRRLRTSRSATTPSVSSVKTASASATTRTRTRPESAWAPATSPSMATPSPTTRAAASWSAGSSPTLTTRAARQ